MSDRQRILALLEELHIPHRIVDHPAVFTVAESMEHIKDKRPIKNLLIKEKGVGRKFLVIMDGETRLDMKAIEKLQGTRKLSFTNAEMLEETLGVTPGSVSVFGLLNDEALSVEVIVDERLLAEKELGFHPNENTATIFMPGEAFKTIIEHTKHKLHIMRME